MSKGKQEAALQAAIDRLVADAVKIDNMAKALYGNKAWIFAEADGNIHIMDGDSDGHMRARQKHIRLTAKGYSRICGGAW